MKRSSKGHRGVQRIQLALFLLLILMATFQIVVFAWNFRRTASSSKVLESSPSRKKWAYAFLLANVDPSDDNIQSSSYRGMFYNILASTYVLKYDNSIPHSQADIVVMIQMAATSKASRLTLQEEALLTRMNIQYRYLPRPPRRQQSDESSSSSLFYDLVMEKFKVLEMTEYSKVTLLDGDLLPLCSLDYLMELSETGKLEETVLHAMYDDPVNAGLFVVTPRTGAYTQLEHLMEQYSSRGDNKWNADIGWGGPPVDYRYWNKKTGAVNKGSGWYFYCANSDQGLLLYWSRFVLKKASFIIGSTIETYSGTSSDPSSTTSSGFLWDYSCLPPDVNPKTTFAENSLELAAAVPFYRDFYHMVGYSKAWSSPLKRPLPKTKVEVKSSSEFWYFTLQQVIHEFDRDNIIAPIDQLHNIIGGPKFRADMFDTGKFHH